MILHPTAGLGVQLGFVAVAFTVAAMVVAGTRARRPDWTGRAIMAAIGWLAFTFLIAGSGLLAHFDVRPTPMLLVFPLALGCALAISLSVIGAQLAELPLAALVGFQAFRLPLELLMHAAAREGTMPNVMSYGARNFDIVSGMLAILVALALRAGAPRALAWLFSAVGIALLANVVAIAFLASPLVRRYGEHELNTFVAYPPFVWLPTVMVAGALAGHLVLLRALRRSR